MQMQTQERSGDRLQQQNLIDLNKTVWEYEYYRALLLDGTQYFISTGANRSIEEFGALCYVVNHGIRVNESFLSGMMQDGVYHDFMSRLLLEDEDDADFYKRSNQHSALAVKFAYPPALFGEALRLEEEGKPHIHMYENAAEQGHARSMWIAAKHFQNTVKNYDKSVKYFRMSISMRFEYSLDSLLHDSEIRDFYKIGKRDIVLCKKALEDSNFIKA